MRTTSPDPTCEITLDMLLLLLLVIYLVYELGNYKYLLKDACICLRMHLFVNGFVSVFEKMVQVWSYKCKTCTGIDVC